MGKFKGWPIVSDYPDRKSHESNPPVQPMVVQTALLSACVNRNLSCPLLVNVLFPPQHSLSAISSAQSPTGGRCSRLQPLWLPTWLWISHKESQEEEPSWTRTPQHTVLFQPLFNHYCCRTVCMLAIQPSPNLHHDTFTDLLCSISTSCAVAEFSTVSESEGINCLRTVCWNVVEWMLKTVVRLRFNSGIS